MNGGGAGNTNWVVKEDVNNDMSDSIFNNGSISDDSMNSLCLYSSSKLAEDASSSSTSYLPTSSSSSTHSNNPLFELSELMNLLPFKRGLSMFYEGKAQSFSSLANVESIKDLPKKEKPNRNKMKPCNRHTISKKASRGTKGGSFFGGSFAAHKNFLRQYSATKACLPSSPFFIHLTNSTNSPKVVSKTHPLQQLKHVPTPPSPSCQISPSKSPSNC